MDNGPCGLIYNTTAVVNPMLDILLTYDSPVFERQHHYLWAWKLFSQLLSAAHNSLSGHRALSGSQLTTSQLPAQHVTSYYGSQTQFPGQQLGKPSTYYFQAPNAAQPQAYAGALFVCNKVIRKNAGSSAAVRVLPIDTRQKGMMVSTSMLSGLLET